MKAYNVDLCFLDAAVVQEVVRRVAGGRVQQVPRLRVRRRVGGGQGHTQPAGPRGALHGEHLPQRRHGQGPQRDELHRRHGTQYHAKMRHDQLSRE